MDGSVHVLHRRIYIASYYETETHDNGKRLALNILSRLLEYTEVQKIIMGSEKDYHYMISNKYG